jgi:hypothetical protein
MWPKLVADLSLDNAISVLLAVKPRRQKAWRRKNRYIRGVCESAVWAQFFCFRIWTSPLIFHGIQYNETNIIILTELEGAAMSDYQIAFKREELYKKIWNTPIVRLAKEYGISDVALAKICKKLNVPRPPRGYWAKLEFKKIIRRPPLPAVSADDPTEFMHYRYSRHEYGTQVAPEIRKNILVKRDITVPANLDNPHRLVKETRAILERARKFENGLPEKNRRACLEVNVSPAFLERALRIMNAAVKGFEAEGFAVAVEGGSGTSSHVSINGEKVHFAITEAYRRVDHVPTPEEKVLKKMRPFWDITKYDYRPTGELLMKIVENGAYGSRKKWSDSKSGRLEEKVGEFIGGAIMVAHMLKIERKAREEADRRREEERKKWEEDEKRRRDEEAHLQKLEQQAALWAKSEQLRTFVQAVESTIEGKEVSEDMKRRVEAWIAWARNRADQIDPIRRIFSGG